MSANPKPITAIVPLGGSGTRLYPLTLDTPKHLVPVANRTLLYAAAGEWARQGVGDFILGATGYSNRVASYRFFGHGGRFKADLPGNTRVYYANYDDREFSRKGSGDVFLWILGQYRSIINGNDILSINGDNLSNVDLAEFYGMHKDKKALLTIAVKGFEHEDPGLQGFGTVTFDPVTVRVSKFQEKSPKPESRYANTAICLFSPEIYKIAGSASMKKLLKELDEEGKPLDVGGGLIPFLVDEGHDIFAYPITSEWSDVGTPGSYRAATRDVLHGQYEFRFGDYQRRGNHLIHEDTIRLLGEGMERIKLGGRCIVGAGAIIQEGAEIENSVIGDNSYIGKDAEIKGVTTLLPFAQIEKNCVLTDCIIGHNTVIGKGSVISSGSVIGDDLHIPEGTTVGIGQRVAHADHEKAIREARVDSRPMYHIKGEIKGAGAIVFTE